MRTRVFASVISASLMVAGRASAQYTLTTIDVQCPATSAATECPTGLTPDRSLHKPAPGASTHKATSLVILCRRQAAGISAPERALHQPRVSGCGRSVDHRQRHQCPRRNRRAVHRSGPRSGESGSRGLGTALPEPRRSRLHQGFSLLEGHVHDGDVPTKIDEDDESRPHPGAIAQRISPDGDIYGCLHDHDLGSSMFGAAWTRSGTFSLTYQGGQVSDGMAVPMSMNNGATPGQARTTVGLFMDMSTNLQSGYLVRDGMLEPYRARPDADLTAIWDINPSGKFVGTYRKLESSRPPDVTVSCKCQMPRSPSPSISPVRTRPGAVACRWGRSPSSPSPTASTPMASSSVNTCSRPAVLHTASSPGHVHDKDSDRTAFFRYKCIIGPGLRARSRGGRKVEASLACRVLNRMTELGRSESSAINR